VNYNLRVDKYRLNRLEGNAEMAQIPDNVRDLFEKPIVASFATVMPNGSPQVTPVWIDYDGKYIRINTARGRQKDRNMKEGTKVTALLVDPQNPYHWAEVRGHVAEILEENEGAREHINTLSHKYNGRDYKGQRPDEYRLMYRIEPDKINGQ
jgi:PPOX class probable F420-dependent enzyme